MSETLTIAAGVYAVELDDELLVWDGRAQALHRLNPFATRAWHAIATSKTTAGATAMIASEVGIDGAQARRDVETLVRELTEAGVLERRGS
jgi:hypothetical protein